MLRSRGRDGRHDAVNLGCLHEVVERLGSHGQAGPGGQIAWIESASGRGIDDHDVAGAKGPRLLHEQPRIAMRGEQMGDQPPARCGHHVERAPAHTSGRSEDGDVEAAAGRQDGGGCG